MLCMKFIFMLICFHLFKTVYTSITKKAAESLEDSVNDVVNGISSVVLSEGQSDSEEEEGDTFEASLGGQGGAEEPGSGGGAPVVLDKATLTTIYKQAYTKFNIKQKDCIKFLIEKVSNNIYIKSYVVLFCCFVSS